MLYFLFRYIMGLVSGRDSSKLACNFINVILMSNILVIPNTQHILLDNHFLG